MNRSESLVLLHYWAEDVRSSAPHPYGYATSPADEVRRHGLAAVRAIRRVQDVDFNACTQPDYCYAHSPDAIRESRLAFRAALRAVGINGPL